MTIRDIRQILRTYMRRYRQSTVPERIAELRRLRVLVDDNAPGLTVDELARTTFAARVHVPDATAEQFVAMAASAALDGGLTLAQVTAAVEAGFALRPFNLSALGR